MKVWLCGRGFGGGERTCLIEFIVILVFSGLVFYKKLRELFWG